MEMVHILRSEIFFQYFYCIVSVTIGDSQPLASIEEAREIASILYENLLYGSPRSQKKNVLLVIAQP
jgi:hypothetical protein